MRLNKTERMAIIRRIRNEIQKANNERASEILENFDEDLPEYQTILSLYDGIVKNCAAIVHAYKDHNLRDCSSYFEHFASTPKFDSNYRVKDLKLELGGYKAIPIPSESTLEDEIILNGSGDCQAMIEALLDKYLRNKQQFYIEICRTAILCLIII